MKFSEVCLGCKHRKPACHGTCPAYQEAKADWDAKMAVIRDAKLKEWDIDRLKLDRVRKAIRRREGER